RRLRTDEDVARWAHGGVAVDPARGNADLLAFDHRDLRAADAAERAKDARRRFVSRDRIFAPYPVKDGGVAVGECAERRAVDPPADRAMAMADERDLAVEAPRDSGTLAATGDHCASRRRTSAAPASVATTSEARKTRW